MKEKLRRFFEIANLIRSGQVPPDADLKFYYEYAPDVDEAKMQQWAKEEGIPFDQAQAAAQEAMIQLQTSPEFKDATLRMAQETEKGKLNQKLSAGLNLVLGASDIAQSISQISQSNQALKKSKRPARPTVPGRDAQLEQALRGAQDINKGVETTLAPVKAEIQDQYLGDLANAKTASGGQASNFGAYAQVAANRRNRAAMGLADAAQEIRMQNQGRLDNLIGMRADETQQMYRNQASLYPYELQQYNNDQQTAAELGSQGRSNLRNSLYNFAEQVAPAVSDYYTQRKYRNLKNTMTAALGETAADVAEKNQRYLDEHYYGYNPNKPELKPEYVYNVRYE